MRVQQLLFFAVGLPGCIWLSSDELQDRQDELGDVDGDGYVDQAYSGGDCDDGDADINPTSTELCDGVDNDCDGLVDEADAADVFTWYSDRDGDGYGDASDSQEACAQPSGYAPNADDCDDGNAAITDGELFYTDGDGDGYGDPEASVRACELSSGLVVDDTDCDDTDPLVYPGAIETLGDALDADCDGDDDAIAFVAVDTRHAVDVLGPRLAVNSSQVFLGWAAEQMDFDSPVNDAAAVAIYDAAALDAGEEALWSVEARFDLGSLGGFDLVADETMFGIARSFTDLDSRSIQLEGVDAITLDTGSYVSERETTLPFDDLQLALSSMGNLTVAGCGMNGAGVHGVQVPANRLVAGDPDVIVDASSAEVSDDHDSCEYDPVIFEFYMGDSEDVQLDYYEFNFIEETLVSNFSSGVPWDIQDTEISAVNGWLVAAISDRVGGDYLYLDRQTDIGSTDIPYIWEVLNSPLDQVDVSATTTGITMACGVDRNAEAWLFWADLEVDEYLRMVQLGSKPMGRIDDCAITVTDDDIVVLALRSLDDLALGFARMP